MVKLFKRLVGAVTPTRFQTRKIDKGTISAKELNVINSNR